MTIVHLNSRGGSRNSALWRGLLTRHREVISFAIFAGLFVLLYIQRALLSVDSAELPDKDGRMQQSPGVRMQECALIDPLPLKGGLVCIEKCIPPSNNTLQGLGLDLNERVNISMPVLRNFPIIEYDKYRLYFPEEKVYLNLTARLANEIITAAAAVEDTMGKKEKSIDDKGYMHSRIYTERLLRRIIAKLFRAGVLDPSKYIVNTGSWIGDNALPWALMLESLKPDDPGKVIAVDPSEKFIIDMVDLANVNGIGNVCARIGVLSSNVSQVAMIGESTEHIKVHTKESIDSGPLKKRQRMQNRASWIDSISLDSLKLQKQVSLLHLDVEGHEGALLEGARATIESSRPIVITEGYNMWPDPVDENDKHVLKVLSELGYMHASEIPEHVGIKNNARNRIWWPDEKTMNAAREVIGKELDRDVMVPWISTELPELY